VAVQGLLEIVATFSLPTRLGQPGSKWSHLLSSRGQRKIVEPHMMTVFHFGSPTTHWKNFVKIQDSRNENVAANLSRENNRTPEEVMHP
jgi:hypothetical protein